MYPQTPANPDAPLADVTSWPPDEIDIDLDRIEDRPGVLGSGVGGPMGADDHVLIFLANDADASATSVPDEATVNGSTVPVLVDRIDPPSTLPNSGVSGPPPGTMTESNSTDSQPLSRHRPIPAGVSCGHPSVSAGSVGLPGIVSQWADDDATYLLTNAHIAAPLGESDLGDPLLQPGVADWGIAANAEDAIGELADICDIDAGGANRTDSALVKVPEGAVAPRDAVGLPGIAGLSLDPPTDAPYVKTGRTSGVTKSLVRSRLARITIDDYFDHIAGFDARVSFQDITVFNGFAEPGDSGSPIGVIDDDGFQVSHLLFAGGEDRSFGVPLRNLMNEHGPFKLAPSH